MQKILKDTVRVYIGKIILPDLTFESEFQTRRKNPGDTINFLKEKYVRVNTEENCYIKESEYNKYFGPTPNLFFQMG